MKRVIIILCLAALFSSCSVSKIPVSFPEPVVRVYEVPAGKEVLFVNSNRWLVSIFKDARSIIQYSDKAEGVLLGKYLLHSGSDAEELIYAIIEITIREGKARISITPEAWTVRHVNSGSAYRRDLANSYAYTKEKAISDLELLFESYLKYLKADEVKF